MENGPHEASEEDHDRSRRVIRVEESDFDCFGAAGVEFEDGWSVQRESQNVLDLWESILQKDFGCL